MKKIKKINLVSLTSNEQDKILGGCSCDGIVYNWGNVSCCIDTNHFSTPSTGSGSTGGGGSTSCDCTGNCMPGDNADFANWVGTKLANQWWS